MSKRKLWRALLAGAVIGLVEAAGLDRERRAQRRPLRVVWLDDREIPDPLARAGVWFLDPLTDPRPEATDLRRPTARGLRLAPLHARRLADALRRQAS